MTERLKQQLDFLLEIDKAKEIWRRTVLPSKDRRENDAEHSWHICLFALLLQEYFPDDVDMLKVVKMLLVHDLVEVYAGDTYLYDEEANKGKREREEAAAEKIFGLLPPDQCLEYKNLWLEFEDKQTADAQYAAFFDRFQPFFLNYHAKGVSWQRHNINREQVLRKNASTLEGPKELADVFMALYQDSIQKGYLS